MSYPQSTLLLPSAAPSTAPARRVSSLRSTDSVHSPLSSSRAGAPHDFFADPALEVPALWRTPRCDESPTPGSSPWSRTVSATAAFEEHFVETAPPHHAPMGRSPRVDAAVPQRAARCSAWRPRGPLGPVGINVSHRSDRPEGRGAIQFARGERPPCADLPQWRREGSARTQSTTTAPATTVAAITATTTTTTTTATTTTTRSATAAAMGAAGAGAAKPKEGRRWILTRSGRGEEDALPLSALLDHSWATACNEEIAYWRRRCAMVERQLALYCRGSSLNSDSASYSHSNINSNSNSNGNGNAEEAVNIRETQRLHRANAATSARDDKVFRGPNEQEDPRENGKEMERERASEKERDEWREEALRLRVDRNALREELAGRMERCEQLETDLLARDEQDASRLEKWNAREAELCSRQEKLAAALRQEHIKVANTSEKIERATAELQDAQDREAYLRSEISRLEESHAQQREQEQKRSSEHESAALQSLVHSLETFLQDSADSAFGDLPSPVRGARAGEDEEDSEEISEEKAAEKTQRSLMWRAADGLRRLAAWAAALRMRHAALREELEVVRADRNELVGQQNRQVQQLQRKLIVAEAERNRLAVHLGGAEVKRETHAAREISPARKPLETQRQRSTDIDVEKKREKEKEEEKEKEKEEKERREEDEKTMKKEATGDAEATATRQSMSAPRTGESPTRSIEHKQSKSALDTSPSRPRRRVTFAETLVVPPTPRVSRALPGTSRSLLSNHSSTTPLDRSPSPPTPEVQKVPALAPAPAQAQQQQRRQGAELHVGRGAMRWHQDMWKQQEEMMGIDIVTNKLDEKQ